MYSYTYYVTGTSLGKPSQIHRTWRGPLTVTLRKHPVLFNSTYHSLNNFFVYFKFIFPLGCNVHIHFVPTPVFLIHYRQSIIFEEWNEGRKEWEEEKIQSKYSYRHTPCAPNGTVSTLQNSVWAWLIQCLLGFRVSEIQVWKKWSHVYFLGLETKNDQIQLPSSLRGYRIPQNNSQTGLIIVQTPKI